MLGLGYVELLDDISKLSFVENDVNFTRRCAGGGERPDAVIPGSRPSLTWGTQQKVKRDLRSGSWAMHKIASLLSELRARCGSPKL